MAVTRTDVASKAGVSGTTVSFVMTGVWKKHGISEATYQKVKKAAAELGYVPNPAAKELRGGKTGRIGLMLWYVNRPFYATLTEKFFRKASECGKSLTLFIRDMEEPLLPFMKNALAQTDGLIVMDECLPELDYAQLPSRKKQLIFINPWQVPGVPTIVNDMAGRIYLATRHLLMQGYDKLFLNSVNPLRTRGFKTALELAGMPIEDSMFVGAGAYDYAHGKELADAVTISDDGKTGIVAANDYVAISTMYHLKQKGYEAGQDYGIVGFDNFEAGQYMSVPLTSVHRSYNKLVDTAFDLINQGESGGATDLVLLPNCIEVRESTPAREGAGTIVLPEDYEPVIEPPTDEEKSLLAEGWQGQK